MSRLTQAIDENRRRAKEQKEETTTRQSGGKSVLRQAIDQARSGERVERATGVPLLQNSVSLNTGRDGVGITPSQTRPSVSPALPSVPSLSSSLRRFTPTQLLQDVLKQSETTRPAGGQATTPTETMSSADMSARLDELRELRDEAEKARNEARLIMTGSRYMTSSMREEQQAILDQAEADYSRYEQEYNELLDRYYQTENEEKRTSLQQDEAMSGQYQSAQDIQADMDKVSAVMAYTVTHDGDAAQVEEYKQYLFDKYGLDQKAVDQYAISGAGGAYVPRTDGGYNNIYELYLELQEKKENAVSTLSEGGYDYERMTGYEDMLEDAAQYREDMGEWQEYAREHPILSSVDTLLTAPFQGFDFLRVMGQNIGHSDRDDPENYVPMNSYDMELTNYINAVRQTVSEEIEGATNWEIFDQNVAAFLYQTGMSIGDSSLNLLAFGPTGALVVGSSTAAANQAKDIIDRGGSKEQAFMGGMAAGAFEAIFEKVSIDNLLATKSVTGWKSWLKETAKQAGIEASEETFTEIANILADAAIMGDNSNYDVAVAEYVAQGMSQEDAERQAFFDLIGQVVQAGVGGAISGGVMGGAVNGVNGMANAAYNRYNQQLVQENDVKNTPILETNPQEGPVQSQNEGEIDSSIPEATRQAVEMLVRGEEISGNQAARIAESEEAVALLSQLTGEAVNTDAPISRVKSDIRALASREGRTSGEAGVNSRATQNVAQTQKQQNAERPTAQRAYDILRVQQAATTLGESGSRALTAAYDGSVDAGSFYAGFAAYYEAGVSGMDMGRVRSEYAQDLTEAQRYAAYTAGQNDAAASLAREQAAAQYAPVAGEDSGLVYDDFVRQAVESGQSTEGQDAPYLTQETAERINFVAKALGLRVRFVDSVREGTANASIQGSEVLVERNNPNPVMFLLGHEWTHRLQETAPTEYRAFREFVADEVQGEARVLLDTYRDQGEDITYEQALDEAAANYAGRMIEDGQVLDDFIQRHRQDRTLLERIRDAIRALVRKLTGAEKKAAQTAEGKLSAALEAAERQVERNAQNQREDEDNVSETKYSLKNDSETLEKLQSENDRLNRRIQELSRQVAELKRTSEFSSFEDEIRNAQDGELDGIVARYTEWEEASGLTDANRELEDLNRQARDVRRNLERARAEAARQAREEYRELYNEEFAKKYASKAARKFGTTSRFDLAGYLTVNGSLLDFSDRKGYRVRDHREISSVLDFLPEYAEYSDGMIEFMNLGNIRMQSYGIDIAKAPNSKQKGVLKRFFNSLGGEVTVDFSRQDGGTDGSVDYPEGTRSDRILNDIDRYFSTGAVPEQSVVSQFHTRYSRKGSESAADIAALQEENTRLRERVNYWRGQTRRTERVTTDKKAVERAARELIRAYNSSLETAEIAGDLQSLYDYIASGRDGSDELTYTEARRRSDAIARKLVDSAAVLEDDAYRDYADLRSYLRSTPLSISAEDSHDIADFGDFRRRNFGRMTIRSGPTNIDQVYQEMSGMWPEFFDETRESTPSDQLVHIAEVLDGIYRVTERNPFSGYFDAAVTDASNEIMERFFDLSQTRPTFADRQARKLDDAKAAGRRRLAEQRERSDARLAELREQNRERVQRAIQRERETRARQIDRLKTRYAARDAAGRERRSARELRARISRHVADLSRRLLRPSDKQHIPEQLRTAVAAMLDAINLESVYTVDPDTGRRRKGGNGDPTKRTEAFRALREQYAKIISEGRDMVIDPLLMGNDAEGIRGSFDAVIAMGDTRLADMSTQQLEIVWQVVKAVEQSVSTAGKILSKAKFAETAEWANAMQRDTAGRRAKQSLTKGHPLIDLETPYTFFSHFGDAGRDIYRMLRDAQDQQQLMADEVAATVRSIISPKEVRKLERTTQTFTTERGDKLTLSTAQIMELYELTQREQAHDHLLKGGVVQPEIESAKIRRGTDAILLTEGDLASIVGTLTDQQKQTADKLQRLTTGLLADYGNQASMAAYGYRKFTEEHYWPLHSAKEGIRSSVERGSGQTRSIANIGLAQAVIPHANNPLDLPGLFSTFSSHAGDMIDYAAWLLPMEDANRLFNFKFRDGEGNLTGRSVKGLLDRVGGEGSQRYWHNLMEDIQNGINAPGDSPMWDKVGKSIGSFKGAAVGGNLRVIIQQPTAFFRAGMVLSPADLSRGLARGVTRGNGWRKALQYSPIAKRKNTGSFDISSPRQMNEILFDDRSGVRKLNDALSAPAGMADAVTWGRLWNACEWATAREHKHLRKGSEAFYQKVNELFTEVIDQTQVVDGVLQRSNIMRSSNAVVKQATSFMGEPIMSLNLMMRAYDQVRYEQNPKKRGRAIKMLGRAATALVVTNTVNALAQSIIDAIRDDDKDKKYWERFWSAFTGLTGEEESAWDKAVAAVFNGNLGGNMNLLGQVPFVKDVLSLAQGYDVSRTDMEIFSDLVRAAQTAMRSADGTGPKTRAYAVKELLSAGAKMFGIPVGNLARDAWGIARSIAAETDNIPLQYEMEKAIYNITNEGNTKRYLDLLYQAQKSGDKAVYEHIYADLVASGITEEKIRLGMEDRMKEDQGVESVDELSRRYLTPNQERTYDRLYGQVSSSPVWRAASPEQREAVEEDIYALTTGTDAGVKLQEKIDGGAAYGITEADYLLYLAAREIADGENEDPEKRNGSIDQAEAQAAIDMLTGLSDEGRAYLWQSNSKRWSEEKNPYR